MMNDIAKLETLASRAASRGFAKTPVAYRVARWLAPLAIVVAAFSATLTATAALTDISTTPVASSSTAVVKPNIMLLMDASTSMGWTHMPDDIEGTSAAFPIGYRNYQCNALYYNPAKKYRLPKGADANTLPIPAFTSAPYNYYSADTTTVDLSTAFRAFDTSTRRIQGNATGINDAAQAAYYYLYSGTQNLSYKGAPCTDADNLPINQTGTVAATGGGTWTRKIVSETSGVAGSDERQNFAIWYTYYRTRLALTKSGVALAFSPISDRYRVGFLTMSPTDSPGTLDSPVNTNKFLPVSDFDATQRTGWFNKLFSQTASGSSPSREGLARVGRYYAGKTDHINKNMGADPMQYSCQQNFTIMTTDGYWNAAAEGNGPVALDGVTPVGQQDGTLTDNSGLTPRPIWDGGIGGSRITTDQSNTYAYAACNTGWFSQSTNQIMISTSQRLQSTSQLTKSTAQVTYSTTQISKTTHQIRQSTSQLRQSTQQNYISTSQTSASTSQNTQSTSQLTVATSQLRETHSQTFENTSQLQKTTYQSTSTSSQLTLSTSQINTNTSQLTKSTSQLTGSTSQLRISTSQTSRSTAQIMTSTSGLTKHTSQLTQSTDQVQQSTAQINKSTSQLQQSTSQLTQSTSQLNQSTTQATQSTSQLTRSTAQIRVSTSQTFSYDGRTEQSTPVSTCTSGGNISCSTMTTGPTPAASCTYDPPTGPNGYTTTSCTTATTGPTGVASCASTSADSSNSYTSTSCNTLTSGPTGVASCTPASAGSSNSYTAVSCNTLNTGPTPVASCASSGANSTNSYTSTSCSTLTTGPTGVSTCAAVPADSTNSYTAKSCNTLTSGPTGVATCATSGADSTNSYTSTSCYTATSGPTPSASCVNTSPSSTNAYLSITCNTVTTGPSFAASCATSGADSSNSYTSTTCTPVTSGPTGVASCAGSGPTMANNYMTTSCSTLTTDTGVASCVPSSASSTNSYVETTCPTVTSGPTASASCTPTGASSSNGYVETTCSTINTGPSFVQTCAASTADSSNSYVTTSCSTLTTGPTGTDSCTPITASSGNDWKTTSCNTATTGPTGVASCLGASADGSNSYTSTTCNTATTGPTPAAACTPASAGPSNSYVTTSCNTLTSGPTPSLSCGTAIAGPGNSYTATNCSTLTTGPTVVGSCAPIAADSSNNYTTTTCNGSNNTTGSPACVPQTGDSSNGYVTITCGNRTVGPIGVASCTPAAASSSNDYTQTVCNTVTTGPTLVATCAIQTGDGSNAYLNRACMTTSDTPTPTNSCTPATANSSNSYTNTTCDTVSTPATGTASCTGATASSSNSYTNTICNTVTSGPTPILSCTPIPASSTNSYVETTCAPVTTGPTFVPSCTATSGPPSGPDFILTTCNTVNTGPTPIASCSFISADGSNGFKSTTCSNLTTGPTGVATCAPAVADSSNSFTSTTCDTATSGPTGVASCTPTTAGSSNGYVETVCNTVDAGPTFVASCSAAAPDSSNGYMTTGCSTESHGPTPIASCSPNSGSNGNNYLQTTCNTVTSGPTGVASCSGASADSSNSYTATTCATLTSGPTGVASCTDTLASSSNGYVATTCQTSNNGPTPIASCINDPAGPSNSYTGSSCNTITTPAQTVQTCNPSGPSSANSYVETICSALPGKKIRYSNTTTTTTWLTSGNLTVGDPLSSIVDPKAPADLDGICYVDPAPSPQPNPALPGLRPLPSATPTVPTRPTASLPPSLPTGCSAWPCSVNTAGTNTGSSNSLADVAQYYYVTDLRPTATNDVVSRGTGPEDDRATWQHMTTFGVGLGVSGTLNYSATYKSDTSGDFADIRTGVKNWPSWPDPTLDYSNNALLYNDAKSIDDFWHAAVNGRGAYFSADDPDSVVKGISDALTGIRSLSGSGAPVTPTSSTPTPGDNSAFIGTFTSEKWYGDLGAYPIDVANGKVSASASWSAQQRLSQLTAPACDNRKIYIFRSGNTGNLAEFTWNSQTCNSAKQPDGAARTDLNTDQQNLFSLAKASTLSQYLEMTDGTAGTVNQRAEIAGSSLVNFVRGYRGKENFVSNDLNKLYRTRDFVLGDIVGSQPAYVKEPSMSYQDTGYDAFKFANRARTPMVYVGANDGMLHAFKAPKDVTDATAGVEQWAYIPTPVMKNLYKLADTEYSALHTFMVDGSPTTGDVFDTGSTTWKTIVVTGLGAGGKGYFAMDVTDPTTPKALWEFNYTDACYDGTGTAFGDCHVGLSFGKPVITKLQGSPGRWVAMFTSGYNNVSSPAKTGDGGGYLYVVDAITGQLIYKIATGAGDSDNPSGLAQINNYVGAAATDNTTQRVYGGDLLGNVWRFDVNDIYDPSGRDAGLIAIAKDPANVRQPITSRIELAEYNGNTILLVGTGQLLGASDVPVTQTQSVYGFVDPLSSAVVYNNLRADLKPMIVNTVTDSSGTYRTLHCGALTTAACSVKGAWYFDLPIAGERVDTNMATAINTLTFITNAPNSSACTAGGESYFNQVDILTGNPPSGENSSFSVKLSNTLGVGLTLIQTTDGLVRAISSLSTQQDTNDATNQVVRTNDVVTSTPPPLSKRVSWRELTQ